MRWQRGGIGPLALSCVLCYLAVPLLLGARGVASSAPLPARITISPPSGSPGTTIAISGSGFTAGIPLRIYWGTGASRLLVGSGHTTEGGIIAGPLRVTVPATATPGSYTIAVADDQGHILTTSSFMVVAPQFLTEAPPLPISAPVPFTSSPATAASGAAFSAEVTEGNPGAGAIAQTFAVDVPAGAVTQTVIISAAFEVPSQAPAAAQLDGTVGVGDAISLTAQTRSGQALHVFARSLLLQLSYSPTVLAGMTPRALTVAYYDTAVQRWLSLPTTIDNAAHLLTATVTHFTLFQVRATGLTQAQVHTVQARLATLAATGPPRLSTLPVSSTAGQPALPGGVPVVFSLPHQTSVAEVPAAVHVLGAPHALLTVTYRWSRSRVVRTAILDSHGYAAVAAPPLFDPMRTTERQVSVEAVVSVGRVFARLSGSFTLTR